MIRTARFSFLAKAAAAIAIIAAMDRLFLGGAAGSWIGGFALAWIGALLATRPALRRRPSLVALAIAAGFAIVLAHDPGSLGWVLFWSALSIAGLMPRIGRFDDAWRWSLRLAAHGLSGPLAPALDLIRLARLRPRRGGHGPAGLAALLALPLGMTALFVALFASANPVIAQALARVRLPGLGELLFWALLLFNIVFAIQNGLDLAFLWSGAPLPPGVTLADYAHRGAYPLIATALLAGLFVLVALKPGSASAGDPAIRRLVVLWVAQNLLLVASSILRTLDYVAAYSLTSLRIAALAWMGLVAIGLALICWRMLAGRSAAWLINANALMAALVLSAASIADLEAGAAAWNVRPARETGGRGVALDLCYLAHTGPSALLSLVALERRPLPPGFRDRVRHVRAQVMADLARQQADWRGWTWRGRYRLETARRLLGPSPPTAATPPPGVERDCGGALHPIATEQPAPAATPAGEPIAGAIGNTIPPLTGAPLR